MVNTWIDEIKQQEGAEMRATEAADYFTETLALCGIGLTFNDLERMKAQQAPTAFTIIEDEPVRVTLDSVRTI